MVKPGYPLFSVKKWTNIGNFFFEIHENNINSVTGQPIFLLHSTFAQFEHVVKLSVDNRQLGVFDLHVGRGYKYRWLSVHFSCKHLCSQFFCNLFASLGILSFSSECIGWAAHEPWHHIGGQVVHCYPKYVSDNGVNFFVFVLIQQVSLPLWINVCVVRQADQSVFWQKLSLSVWRVTELWVEVIQGLVSTARPCVWSQCHVVIM